MNIFVLDKDPKISAKFHCDKHVVKMIVETAQLLSTAHHMLGTWEDGMYKVTHSTVGTAIWARTSLANYNWLAEMGIALCEEYTLRYKKIHKTEPLLRRLYKKKIRIPNIGITRFSLTMPDEIKIKNEDKFEEAVKSYRNFYIKDKNHFAKWKYCETPKWYLI